MPQKEDELPTTTDAQEWQYHAQTNTHAAVQLAQNMAIDYGKKLVIHRHPTVELRYEGRGFGKEKEPPCLFYARQVANEVLTWNGLSPGCWNSAAFIQPRRRT